MLTTIWRVRVRGRVRVRIWVRGRVRIGDKVRVRVRVRVKVRVRLALSLNLTLTRTPSPHCVRVGLGRLHRAGQGQPRVAHCRGISPRLEVDLAASVQRGRVPRPDL